MDTDINKNPQSATTSTSAETTSPFEGAPKIGKNNPVQKLESSSGIPVYSSQSLFGSIKEIGIEHEGSFYRLRITRQGKLILNK